MLYIRLELEKVTHAIAFINAFDFERGRGGTERPRMVPTVYDRIRPYAVAYTLCRDYRCNPI